MRIYLVRHGQTELNQQKCYYGMTDVPLDESGVAQAKKLQGLLASVIFDRVYSSPLQRAVTTAECILVNATEEILTDSRLCEQNFGIFEGMTYEQICSSWPDELASWNTSYDDYRIPDGESFRDVRERIDSFLSDLWIIAEKEMMKEETVLITAHKGTLGHMLASLVGLPLEGYWNFTFDQGCYSCVDLQDGYAIIRKINASDPC